MSTTRTSCSKIEDAFHEAYMTHTSTSPNYQILASLDVGRRQVELEGFELVEKQRRAGDGAARAYQRRTAAHQVLPISSRCGDLIPAEFRQSGIEAYYDPEHGWSNLKRCLGEDEFVLDPTQITLFTRYYRHRRRHLQARVPDGQLRYPDQQDLAQHRAVHDQHRHHPQLARLSHRGAGQDRRRSSTSDARGFEPDQAAAATSAVPPR